MVPKITLQEFDKWVVDFVGPINPPSIRTGLWYIITMANSLIRLVEATLVRDCTAMTAARFLFDHVVSKFGYPNILVSD